MTSPEENTGPTLSRSAEWDRGLTLLVPWTPWHRVFLTNLFDLLSLREPPRLWLISRPAQFWPDVFVPGGLPWRSLGRSALYHIFAVVVLWGFSVTWLQRPSVRPRNPFENSKITYYSVSEYLPPLDTGDTPAQEERKGEPAYARQRIVSRPPEPDNLRQTIITPNPLKLPHDVHMPNIVAWTPVPSPVPEAAMQHSTSQLVAPAIPVAPVAPPPDANSVEARRLHMPAAEAIAPAPSAEAVASKAKLPSMPAPEVIAPPPSTDVQSNSRLPKIPQPSVIEPPVSAEGARRLGEVNVAHLDPTVAAPKLPVPPQRAGQAGSAGGRQAGNAASPGAAVQPPPSLTGIGDSKSAAGQLIALGLDPAPVAGPVSVPAGSRHGEFEATPEGQPGARGIPSVKGGASGHGGNGNGAGSGHGEGNAGPPGISISPGPVQPPAGPVVSAPVSSNAPKATLMASLGPSRVADMARATRPSESVTLPSKIEDRKIEEKVFGAKKYYSMILNMPNLTSAGGSWIIRFAELHETTAGGELTAPVATLKVDPAYPPEAIRDRIEGTVMLYAVIRKDGSVGEVKVLRGVDGRLDQNARVALLRWHFRPATKNGAAVDLEAVVQIPFVAKRAPF